MTRPKSWPARTRGGLLNYTHLIDGLHACAVLTGLLTSTSIAGRFLFGVPSIVAVILNYARGAEVRGTWLESHFNWQIRTFWFALLWVGITLLVGAPLTLIVIGIYVVVIGFAIVGLGAPTAWRVAGSTCASTAPCRSPSPRHRRLRENEGMRIRASFAVLCLSAALGGCGQKGSLYLPDAAPKAVPAAPASKSPTTPAGATAPATPAADDPATRRKTPTMPDPESSQ